MSTPSQLEHGEPKTAQELIDEVSQFIDDSGFTVIDDQGFPVGEEEDVTDPSTFEFVVEDDLTHFPEVPEEKIPGEIIVEETEEELSAFQPLRESFPISKLQFLLEHARESPEANIPSFNRDLLSKVVDRNVNESGDIINIKKLKRELIPIIDRGLSSGLANDITVKSFIRTIGNVLHSRDDVEELPIVIEEIILSRISEDLLTSIHFDKSSSPTHLNDIFKGEILDIIDQKEVDIDAQREVLSLFEEDLRERLFSINADLNFNNLRDVTSYIDEHVVDDQLKKLLEAKAIELFSIRSFEDGVSVQRGETLTPISASKFTVAGFQPRLEMADIIRDKLEEIKQGDIAGVPKKVSKRQLTKLKNEIQNFSDLAGLGIKISKVSPVPSSIKTISDRLERVAKRLGDVTNVRFTYVPIINAEGQTLNLSQMVSMLRKDIASRTVKKPRHKLNKIKNPKKFINQTPNIMVKIMFNDKEIEIKPNATTKELLLLSSSLIAESGTLKNVDDEPLLQIIKNSTEVRDVLAVLLNEQKHNVAKIIKLTYEAESNVGGQFIGGYLAPLHRKELQKSNLRVNTLHPTLQGGNLFNMKSTILSHPFKNYYHPLGIHEPPFVNHAKGGRLVFGKPSR